jgi:hypothetical protein
VRIALNLRCLLAAISCTCTVAASADTLLVVGTVPASGGDVSAVSQLQSLGQSVTVIDDGASSAASANGMDLVVISDSVVPDQVGDKFSQVAVPVVVFEPWLYDNLGMTGPVAKTDYGRSGLQTQLRMSGTHALTAGLSGVVTVGAQSANFSWGVPGAEAVVAATLKGNSTRATIFAYDSNAQLTDGTAAPARRVALHLNTGALAAWSANGRELFDAAILWALDQAPPPSTVVRIWPLGDSITRGRIDHWSYRRDLEAALTGANCAFDFVGSASGPSSGPGEPLIDRDHDGHSGLRTDEIRNRMDNWMPGNDHDWALVHVGTNDVLQGTSIAEARANIADIIDILRGANANVGILLAQVIPNLPENEADVAALNDAIASVAAEKDQPSASPVIVVDHYSGYSTFTHNYDQIHPNDAGEALMAQRWFEALLPRIAGSCNP